MDVCSQLAEGQAKYTATLKSTTAPQITDSAVCKGAKPRWAMAKPVLQTQTHSVTVG